MVDTSPKPPKLFHSMPIQLVQKGDGRSMLGLDGTVDGFDG
ncbi:hypothetical protein BN961_01757 [Afipia felis]|uniref:Uncharacterized protein n=1 Tax=Afipia felis TaxID=1035 RepID=A0A090N7C1_AFIFE|nr:hypothetical protein BN961_01757 [Afipia felis]